MIIKFDFVELVVSRIVRAIDKTIAEDIPQERREKDLETKNYIAHIRGDYLNSNLRRIAAIDGIELHPFKRYGWEGRLLIDRENKITIGVTTQANLQVIPRKKDRNCPNYTQTLLKIMNGDLESPATQLSFLPPASQFDDEVYEDDFDSIMAGVLDPDSGFRHCIVGYTADHDEIRDIAFYLLNADFEIVEKYDLRSYIKPDFSRLTATNSLPEPSAAAVQSARSLVKLKKNPGTKPALKESEQENEA